MFFTDSSGGELMGTRAVTDDGPAYFTHPLVRGDDYSRLYELFTSFAGFDGDTTTVKLDITGRTYSGSIATTIGGTVVATPTITVVNAALGQFTVAMSDTITDQLTQGRYVFDVIENPGTSSERMVILGLYNMQGRATA